MRQHTTRSSKRRRSTIAAGIAGAACVAALCASLSINAVWGIGCKESLLDEALLDETAGENGESSDESVLVLPLFANERKLIATAAAMDSSRSERMSEAQEASDKPEENASVADDAAEDDEVAGASLVEELLQYPELPAGCESVALTCVLNAMGYDVAATDIVENYLSIDPTYSDANSFLGSPYTGGYAFPSAVIATANAYLADAGSSAHARDASGSTFDELLQIVDSGTPVLVWSTMYFAEPAFTGASVGPYLTYYNEHCVVLYGYTDDVVYVSDPLEGLVARDRAEFERLYEACGALAVVVER